MGKFGLLTVFILVSEDIFAIRLLNSGKTSRTQKCTKLEAEQTAIKLRCCVSSILNDAENVKRTERIRLAKITGNN